MSWLFAGLLVGLAVAVGTAGYLIDEAITRAQHEKKRREYDPID